MATRTYYGTVFHPDLTKATICLHIYDTSKYDRHAKETQVKVTGVKSWTVVSDDIIYTQRIEALGMAEDIYHEYLVLNYADGHSEIYQNTKVAMFVL